PSTLAFAGNPSLQDWVAFSDLLDGQLRDTVVHLNDVLARSHRHFGYRVANEIARFVTLVDTYTDGTPETLWAALDIAILQKVLPKFHGTQQELESILGE